jgi:hypothetical protein
MEYGVFWKEDMRDLRDKGDIGDYWCEEIGIRKRRSVGKRWRDDGIIW